MRYKMQKHALLSHMGELEQNQAQRVNFLRHNISCLMSVEHFALFDCVAQGYAIYNMLLQDCFELLRLQYSDYLIVVQRTNYQFIIEIRKKENLV